MNYPSITKTPENEYLVVVHLMKHPIKLGVFELKGDAVTTLKTYLYGFADGAGRIGKLKAQALHAQGITLEMANEKFDTEYESLALLTEQQAEILERS